MRQNPLLTLFTDEPLLPPPRGGALLLSLFGHPHPPESSLMGKPRFRFFTALTFLICLTLTVYLSGAPVPSPKPTPKPPVKADVPGSWVGKCYGDPITFSLQPDGYYSGLWEGNPGRPSAWAGSWALKDGKVHITETLWCPDPSGKNEWQTCHYRFCFPVTKDGKGRVIKNSGDWQEPTAPLPGL